MESKQLRSFVTSIGREGLRQIQLKKFQWMVDQLLEHNRFYGRKLKEQGIRKAADIQSFEDFKRLPFTTRGELSADQASHPPYGTNLTTPPSSFVRVHHTSGTKGQPLRCLDTPESWDWWKRCWADVYEAAGVDSTDRIFFAFSFGPFIGFWSAFEAAQTIGAMAFPGGGMSSHQRVKAIFDNDISVLICTPSYALHLSEVAAQEGVDIAASSVRTTIQAGEPGASIPMTKQRIEELWGARCYDHAGATEVGAWGFECLSQRGLHLNEGEFIFEVVDPSTEQPAQEGELIITNLGRLGMPVVRYRTGDHVLLLDDDCDCGRSFRLLNGGVIGRVDDAIVIRGINVFPSAIENLVRRFPEIGEFAVDCYRRGQLDEMDIRIEAPEANDDQLTTRLRKEIRHALSLRVNVSLVPFGSLPRFDLKNRRFTDHRSTRSPEKAISDASATPA